MTSPLWLSLIGLALVDSVNVSTIWIVVLILLIAKRPAATGWGFLAGACITVFTFLVLLFFGASFAESAVADLTLWLRRVVFTLLAVALIWLGVRRLKSRPRREYGLPSWVNAWTALPLGLLATLGDLPNAFPMFLAIERLTNASVQPGEALPVLVVYVLIYALPTLAILVLGLVFKDRLRGKLQELYSRYATGEAKASWKIATLCFIGAAASLAILIFAVG